MKTIICGGRDYFLTRADIDLLDVLWKKWPITEVVCGGAKGADTGGQIWAKARGIPVIYFLADWGQFGWRAGVLRNQQMADYADALVAFPGGSGTRDMITRANKKGLRVYEINKH